MKTRIKELRLQKGMTQKELAHKANVSLSWLSHVENGTKEPGLKSLVKIAQALDVSLRDIFLE